MYYLDSGSLGIMALAKSMRMPLINLPTCSLLASSSKSLGGIGELSSNKFTDAHSNKGNHPRRVVITVGGLTPPSAVFTNSVGCITIVCAPVHVDLMCSLWPCMCLALLGSSFI